MSFWHLANNQEKRFPTFRFDGNWWESAKITTEGIFLFQFQSLSAVESGFGWYILFHVTINIVDIKSIVRERSPYQYPPF